MAELLNKSLNITIFGAGYVGISLALLLSKSNVDIIPADDLKDAAVKAVEVALKEKV